MRPIKQCILFAFIICTHSILCAQSKTQDISFDLTKTFTSNTIQLESVGGDLVIGNSDIVKKCEAKELDRQTVFSAPASPQTIFVNIANASGNGCVSLRIVTTSGSQTISIPSSSQTGVLKFTKVKKAELILDRKLSNTVPETVTSTGSATVWF